VVEMGAEPVRIPPAARRSTTTALAHGANHLITLVGESASCLRGAGVNDPPACSARCSPPRWTTPCGMAIARSPARWPEADAGTVRKHRDVTGQARAGDACRATGPLPRAPARRAAMSGCSRGISRRT